MDEINSGFLFAQLVNFVVIALCLTVPLVFTVMLIRGRFRLSDDRKLKRGGEPITFENRGTQVMPPVQLLPGAYQVTYTFESVTRVDVIDTSSGERETLLIKSGTGSVVFSVEHEGRYTFEVEPQDEAVSWRMAVSPLGLPSR
jgi:hypothetical protein